MKVKTVELREWPAWVMGRLKSRLRDFAASIEEYIGPPTVTRDALAEA